MSIVSIVHAWFSSPFKSSSLALARTCKALNQLHNHKVSPHHGIITQVTPLSFHFLLPTRNHHVKEYFSTTVQGNALL